jgi:hypothetical protein
LDEKGKLGGRVFSGGRRDEVCNFAAAELPLMEGLSEKWGMAMARIEAKANPMPCRLKVAQTSNRPWAVKITL